SQIAGLAVFNLALETLDKFIPAINAVTTKDVTTFSDKYLATPSSLVIVGKASAFSDPLKKDFPETRVIAQTDLDLNRADLVKRKYVAGMQRKKSVHVAGGLPSRSSPR